MEILNYWVMPGIEHRREFDEDYAQALIVTAEHVFGIDNVRARTRKREVCELRQLCIYILRQRTRLTTTAIGRIFALNHASVTHSVQMAERLLEVDRAYQRRYKWFVDRSAMEVEETINS